MQTAADVTRQIAQVKREIIDITASLDRITDTQDLIAAESELSNRQNVLNRLQARLQEAQEREQVQEEQARRAGLERQRDNATAEHAELDSAFETIMLDLEQHILDRLDDLDAIATQRGKCESQRSNAVFELRGRQVDWANAGKLSDGLGWFSTASPNARSPVRQALFELYAARHGMYGKLQLPGQDDGHRGIFGIVPRPQEPEQLDPDAELRAQLVQEFAAKNR